jgi:hypothetical protein
MKNILYDYKLKNSFYVDSTWESEYLAKGATEGIMNVLLKHSFGYIKQYFGVNFRKYSV